MRQQSLRRGQQRSVEVKGAPYPPVPPSAKGDRQQRPRYRVKKTDKPRELRQPSPNAEVAKNGGDDPRGNRGILGILGGV